MAYGEPGTCDYGWEEKLAETLVAPLPIEGGHGLLETVDGPMIIALKLVCYAKIEVGQRVQDEIPARRGERTGALGKGDGVVMGAHEIAML
jgi:hypothetical protein